MRSIKFETDSSKSKYAIYVQQAQIENKKRGPKSIILK